MRKSKFFCDIQGTFTGNEKTREKDLKKFASNLDKLAALDNVDILVFSFISSDEMKYIFEYINELSPYLKETRVEMGEQYSEQQMLKNGKIFDNVTGKASQILKNIKTRNYKTIYYADDSNFNHLVTSKIMSIKEPEKTFAYFKPSSSSSIYDFDENKYSSEKKGIEGLNAILDDYIKIKSINNSKTK